MVIREIITGEIWNGHDFWSERGNDTPRLAYGSWHERLDVQDDVEIRNSRDFVDLILKFAGNYLQVRWLFVRHFITDIFDLWNSR